MQSNRDEEREIVFPKDVEAAFAAILKILSDTYKKGGWSAVHYISIKDLKEHILLLERFVKKDIDSASLEPDADFGSIREKLAFCDEKVAAVMQILGVANPLKEKEGAFSQGTKIVENLYAKRNNPKKSPDGLIAQLIHVLPVLGTSKALHTSFVPEKGITDEAKKNALAMQLRQLQVGAMALDTYLGGIRQHVRRMEDIREQKKTIKAQVGQQEKVDKIKQEIMQVTYHEAMQHPPDHTQSNRVLAQFDAMRMTFLHDPYLSQAIASAVKDIHAFQKLLHAQEIAEKEFNRAQDRFQFLEKTKNAQEATLKTQQEKIAEFSQKSDAIKLEEKHAEQQGVAEQAVKKPEAGFLLNVEKFVQKKKLASRLTKEQARQLRRQAGGKLGVDMKTREEKLAEMQRKMDALQVTFRESSNKLDQAYAVSIVAEEAYEAAKGKVVGFAKGALVSLPPVVAEQQEPAPAERNRSYLVQMQEEAKLLDKLVGVYTPAMEALRVLDPGLTFSLEEEHQKKLYAVTQAETESKVADAMRAVKKVLLDIALLEQTGDTMSFYTSLADIFVQELEIISVSGISKIAQSKIQVELAGIQKELIAIARLNREGHVLDAKEEEMTLAQYKRNMIAPPSEIEKLRETEAHRVAYHKKLQDLLPLYDLARKNMSLLKAMLRLPRLSLDEGREKLKGDIEAAETNLSTVQLLIAMEENRLVEVFQKAIHKLVELRKERETYAEQLKELSSSYGAAEKPQEKEKLRKDMLSVEGSLSRVERQIAAQERLQASGEAMDKLKALKEERAECLKKIKDLLSLYDAAQGEEKERLYGEIMAADISLGEIKIRIEAQEQLVSKSVERADFLHEEKGVAQKSKSLSKKEEERIGRIHTSVVKMIKIEYENTKIIEGKAITALFNELLLLQEESLQEHPALGKALGEMIGGLYYQRIVELMAAENRSAGMIKGETIGPLFEEFLLLREKCQKADPALGTVLGKIIGGLYHERIVKTMEMEHRNAGVIEGESEVLLKRLLSLQEKWQQEDPALGEALGEMIVGLYSQKDEILQRIRFMPQPVQANPEPAQASPAAVPLTPLEAQQKQLRTWEHKKEASEYFSGALKEAIQQLGALGAPAWKMNRLAHEALVPLENQMQTYDIAVKESSSAIVRLVEAQRSAAAPAVNAPGNPRLFDHHDASAKKAPPVVVKPIVVKPAEKGDQAPDPKAAPGPKPSK